MSAALQNTLPVLERSAKQALWDALCIAHDIAAMGVSLLAALVQGCGSVACCWRWGYFSFMPFKHNAARRGSARAPRPG